MIVHLVCPWTVSASTHYHVSSRSVSLPSFLSRCPRPRITTLLYPFRCYTQDSACLLYIPSISHILWTIPLLKSPKSPFIQCTSFSRRPWLFITMHNSNMTIGCLAQSACFKYRNQSLLPLPTHKCCKWRWAARISTKEHSNNHFISHKKWCKIFSPKMTGTCV